MKLDPGKLDQRVTLLAPAAQATGFSGQVKDGKAPVGQIWARVKGLGGRELRQAMQAQSMATHEVTIRDYLGITEQWAVEWKGRTLNIEAVVDEDTRDGFMVLNVVEQTTGA